MPDTQGREIARVHSSVIDCMHRDLKCLSALHAYPYSSSVTRREGQGNRGGTGMGFDSCRYTSESDRAIRRATYRRDTQSALGGKRKTQRTQRFRLGFLCVLRVPQRFNLFFFSPILRSAQSPFTGVEQCRPRGIRKGRVNSGRGFHSLALPFPCPAPCHVLLGPHRIVSFNRDAKGAADRGLSTRHKLDRQTPAPSGCPAKKASSLLRARRRSSLNGLESVAGPCQRTPLGRG